MTNRAEIRHLLDALVKCDFESILAPLSTLANETSAYVDDAIDKSYSFIDESRWDEWENNWCSTLMEKSVIVSRGMTRMAVYDDDNKDFVIKMSVYDPDVSFYDYSAAEVKAYGMAIEARLEKFFAKAERLEDWHTPKGHIVSMYMMDFADVDMDGMNDSVIHYFAQRKCEEIGVESFENLTSSQKDSVYSYASYGSEGMRHFVCAVYGAEGCRLMDFLEDHYINDTHCGNWGYINDQLVLIDYGGFQQAVV